MARVKTGQLSEVGKLFDRYHIVLFNFSLRITLDRAKSEDLVQSIFYRVLRYYHTFNSNEGTFRSWLFSIARNAHADFIKEENKMAAALGRARLSLYGSQEEGSFREDDFEKLAIALSQLSPTDQELIVLSRFNRIKYAKIAKMKQVSVAAIKVRIHRAIKALKDLYFSE